MSHAQPAALHFGRWLKREIANIGTYVQFAQLVGVCHKTVARWVADPSPDPRMYIVVRIARALNVPRELVEEKLTESRGEMVAAA